MKLQKALLTLHSNQTSTKNDALISKLDSRILILTTVIYLVFVLSLPLVSLAQIIWFAVYPIIMAPLTGTNYSNIFIKSLWVLPLILLIGIFNPILDHTEAFKISGVTVSYGWLTFSSIIVRGLLCMQALIILINYDGFLKICESLRSFGLPKILTVQLLMLYRYLGVLLEEAQRMHISIISRGYGKSSFPLKMWTQFIGSLFINTVERSKRIHMAMSARCFDGEIQLGETKRWNLKDIYFLIVWSSIFILLRFYNLSDFLFSTF
ncbi:MAG: cobalt ECF transporter T component CbiQ [Muribaculaceae bacterium]|nr:cobalt ECF transporter T component CbiQ [Muribaculaceae bacterium]